MRIAFFAVICVACLAGCSDPLAGIEKLSEIEMSEAPATRSIVASPEELDQPSGFLARILGRSSDTSAAQAAVVEDSEKISAKANTQKLTEDEIADLAGSAEAAPAEPSAKRGLLALLRRGGVSKEQEPADPAVAMGQGVSKTEDLRTASLAPDMMTPRPSRRGQFGGMRSARLNEQSDSIDVGPGVPVPFGTVGRACAVRGGDLGKRIEKAGAGRGYALYDSAPGATTPRPFYVTGFADGCPRQFTAALAMFGAPAMHEQLRYGRPADQYPYSDTDKAYEKIKSRICGASRKKPCGAKISRLERNTIFISVYERFGNNGRWADILLHDGAVMAAAIKTAQ